MGIYIKGMEMPTTCGRCWFCHAVGNDKWHCRLTGKSFASYSVGWGSENNTGENGQQPYIRRDDCPLIPVPPHGDLIDRREAIIDANERAYDFWLSDDEVNASIQFLKEQPTIVPADPAEEGK